MSLLKNVCASKIIKNVSSSTSYKNTPSFRLSLRELKKILPNTFIYESILIIKKKYINANNMNTQIFNSIEYDLNGHWRSEKVTFIENFVLIFLNSRKDRRKDRVFLWEEEELTLIDNFVLIFLNSRKDWVFCKIEELTFLIR